VRSGACCRVCGESGITVFVEGARNEGEEASWHKKIHRIETYCIHAQISIKSRERGNLAWNGFIVDPGDVAGNIPPGDGEGTPMLAKTKTMTAKATLSNREMTTTLIRADREPGRFTPASTAIKPQKLFLV
jgi:hypothetical protein